MWVVDLLSWGLGTSSPESLVRRSTKHLPCRHQLTFSDLLWLFKVWSPSEVCDGPGGFVAALTGHWRTNRHDDIMMRSSVRMFETRCNMYRFMHMCVLDAGSMLLAPMCYLAIESLFV